MSWSMWHIYGTGFDVADVNEQCLEQFLRKHESSCNEGIKDYLRSLDENAGSFDTGDIEEISSSICSVAEPIAEIMYKETGIIFSAPGVTDEGEDYVLFCANEPWNYNEKEKALTFEGLCGLMKPYAEELGVDFETDVDLVYSG